MTGGGAWMIPLCGLVLCEAASASASVPRSRVSINDGWRFRLEALPDHAARSNYKDQHWPRVVLPHTWNREDAFDKRQTYHRGTGWYRKRLSIPESTPDSRFYVHFEAANQIADVFLNGQKIGQHVGGYTAFRLDITEHIRLPGPQLLAVRVSNAHHPDVPPLNADFTFYGGLYRDVWLIRTGALHFDMSDHASLGLFVTTPTVEPTGGVVRIQGRVVNERATAQTVWIRHRVMDAKGKEVTAFGQKYLIQAGASKTFDHRSARIARPRLWSPADPYLYRVVSDIEAADGAVDRVRQPLGFRWFSVDPDRGFIFNGKKLELRGTNRHQDRSGYGSAVPNWVHRRDLEMIRADGFNFVRLAHYPQDPAVLKAADRLGLLVWEEIPVVNRIHLNEAFARNANAMLVEMIRQHANHPSVVMWGYMNEIMLQKPDPAPAGYDEAVLALAKRLQQTVRQEDPTRLTAMAQSKDEVYDGTGLSEVSDVLGLNLYFGWYYGKLSDLGGFLDRLHRAHPARTLMVSEYGAGSDLRVHARTPRRFDFSAEYQQRFFAESVPQIRDRGYLAGSAIWNHFDFGSSHRQDTLHGVNQKGLYEFDREPKDVARLLRAHFSAEPVLHIATRDYQRRASETAKAVPTSVSVFGNLERAELLLNGRSLGSRRFVRHVARWPVGFRSGVNRLYVRGVFKGRRMSDSAEVRFEARNRRSDAIYEHETEWAVNLGAHYTYVDAAARVWTPDVPFERSIRTHHRIFLTDDDPLFQAARRGDEPYHIDVPDGLYEVAVGLAEVEDVQVGERIFTVKVNGRPVFQDVDLVGNYGRYVAVWRSTEVVAADGHGITVDFDLKNGSPLLNAVRIRRCD